MVQKLYGMLNLTTDKKQTDRKKKKQYVPDHSIWCTGWGGGGNLP